MLKKIDMKKFAQLAKEKGKPKKGVTPIEEKGIQIGLKRAREKTPDI